MRPLIAIVASAITFSHAAIASAQTVPEKTPTGFFYPIGQSRWDSGAGGWLARDKENGGKYEVGKYHLGVDMLVAEGASVFAIADGKVLKVYTTDAKDTFVLGKGNSVAFIQHESEAGAFVGVYMHIRPNVAVGDTVQAGQDIGTVGPWYSAPHLHFGVRPGSSVPSGSWGRAPNGDWPAKKGYEDPVGWIVKNRPKKAADIVAVDKPNQLPTGAFRSWVGKKVVSVFDDRTGAVLDSDEIINFGIKESVTKSKYDLSAESDAMTVSRNGCVFISATVEETNPNNGRYYGHYLVYDAKLKKVLSDPFTSASHQMGMAHQFIMSYDGKRILIVDGAGIDGLYQLNASGRGYTPIKVGGKTVVYEYEEPTLLQDTVQGISRDGTIIATEDGKVLKLGKTATLLTASGGQSKNSYIFSLNNDASMWIGYSEPPYTGQTQNMNAFTASQKSYIAKWSLEKGKEEVTLVGSGNDYYNYFTCVNDNVVIGTPDDTSSDRPNRDKLPFFWTKNKGIRSLIPILKTLPGGSPLAKWRTTAITWITPDGRVIAGKGANLQGKAASWLLCLPEKWYE